MANLNFTNSWLKKVANLNFTNSSVSENYLTLTFHFSNLLNSNFFQKVMHQVPTWTLVEFWCGSFKSRPTLPLICPRSPGCIHPSMLTHEANCRERGAALVKPAKWRPEFSSCHLMTSKSSMFIPCIYLTTLMHFDWTSGVRIASYSHRSLKCATTTRGPQKKLLEVLDQRRRRINSSSQHCSPMETKF